MRALVTIISAVALCGCACLERKPRWEVTLNVSVETKPDPMNKVTSSVTLKRPSTLK